LANLASAIEELGTRANQVRVLFVTVDPNRDAAPALAAYARSFAPQIDGLRGTDDQLTDIARRYRVIYNVTPDSHAHAYQVMHSDAVFFFDRNGRARLVATKTDDVAGTAADLKRLLDM
jgi:protein SCO1/2